MREAGRAGTVQAGEEKAQGDLIHGHKYLMGGRRPSQTHQWYPVKGQEAVGRS